jgi:7-cyano-7-deazaguanine reductase
MRLDCQRMVLATLHSARAWIYCPKTIIFQAIIAFGTSSLGLRMPMNSPKRSAVRRSGSTASFQGLDRRYDVQSVDAVDVEVLATFPYEYQGKDVIINIDTNEFSAVCPYSGLPDFATLHIDYIPRAEIIELRSLKYYLLSFRSVGIYQEHVVNRILDDLVRACRPKWMRVAADYNIRGGVHSIASREWGKKHAR